MFVSYQLAQGQLGVLVLQELDVLTCLRSKIRTGAVKEKSDERLGGLGQAVCLAYKVDSR